MRRNNQYRVCKKPVHTVPVNFYSSIFGYYFQYMKAGRLIITILCFISFATYGQDTLTFLNGKTDCVILYELNPVDEYITYHSLKNPKKMYILSLRELYSISYKDSIHIITYEQDSSARLELNTEQMSYYIRGEQFASKHYKAPWITVGGVVAGTAGPVILRAYLGFLVPTAYCGIVGISKVHLKKQQAKYPELFNNEYFIDGYKDQAKHKKVKNAIWGSLVGLGVGLITYGILSSTN
jgi:hypothetical protein